MASWMIHLRIADKLLDAMPELSPVEFIMGNIAPDSGVPNEDWTRFQPSKKVSHFRTDDGTGKKEIDLNGFREKYLTEAQQEAYRPGQYAFYLGYYTHLITDTLWSEQIGVPTLQRFEDMFRENAVDAWEKVKQDWYDLDFLYLKKHPGFRAFRVYLGSVGFQNTYLDIFSEDAFDNRRAYITEFYLQKADHLEREYPYLTEAEADRFVEYAVSQILLHLKTQK